MITRLRRLETTVEQVDVTRIESSVARIRSALEDIDVRLGLLDAHAKVSMVPVQLTLVNDVTELKDTVAKLEPRLNDIADRTGNISGGDQGGKKWTTIFFGGSQARFRPDGVFAVYDEKNRRMRLTSAGQ